MTRSEDQISLREARDRYFAANGLGDGGYQDDWVKLQAGPLPIYLPNSKQRVRSVRLHDLHHPLTGYDTSWSGEAEIGAWEIASGCGDHYAAWGLNLGAMAIGLLIAPARVWRAFRRGCHSANLYRDAELDDLLSSRLGETRKRLRLDTAVERGSLVDHLRFLSWSLISIATLMLPTALLLLLPLWSLVRYLI